MKFHIIVEDAGSGKEFWAAVNKEFLDSKGNIIEAGGVTNLDKELRKNFELGNISSGDYILIAFDNTGTLQASVQMEKLKKHATEYKLSGLIFTTYYCFEEIFLSFERLLDWVKPRLSDSEIALIQFIGNSIRERKDYLTNHSEFETEFNQLVESRHLTIKALGREKLSANLLSYITQQNIGFKITKGSIGSCWIHDCCQTSVDVFSGYDNKITKFIKQCGLTEEEKAKTKLEAIFTASVLATGKVKNDFFDRLNKCITTK